MSPYLKAIGAALTTLVVVAIHWVVSGELNNTELAIGATGLIGSTLVYFTTNIPGYPFLKALVPAVTGSLAAISLWIENGEINRVELEILLTALGVAAVAYFTENTSSDDVVINELGSVNTKRTAVR